MNKIQELIWNCDRDSPWYTIASATRIEAKYIRQSSGTNCFAVVDLEIMPVEPSDRVLFENKISAIDLGSKTIDLRAENIDEDSTLMINNIDRSICRGIEKACLDLTQKQQLIRGIKVNAIAAKYHPVDSRAYCYEAAVYLALLKAFNQVGYAEL